MVKNNIHLEVCRTSNIQTDVFDTIDQHCIDKYVNYTIAAIGLVSEFNSKSTFYNDFKKLTHLSPVQFKKQFSN